MQFKSSSVSALVVHARVSNDSRGALLLGELGRGKLKAGGLGGRAGLILLVKRPLCGDVLVEDSSCTFTL